MATRDVRFFDAEPTEVLPDGQPRRGLSVVAALSRWLVHTNRRQEGSWSHRYERGIPAGDLVAVEATGATGTTVRFLVDDALVVPGALDAEQLRAMAHFPWLDLSIETSPEPPAT